MNDDWIGSNSSQKYEIRYESANSRRGFLVSISFLVTPKQRGTRGFFQLSYLVDYIITFNAKVLFYFYFFFSFTKRVIH